MKQMNRVVEVQGVKVMLVFVSKTNDAIPPIVKDILKTAYTRQQTA